MEVEVEAGHPNYITPQFFQQGDFGNQLDPVSANYNVPQNQYFHQKFVNTDSGLTCNTILPPRKRSRDSTVPNIALPQNSNDIDSQFLGEDNLPQIQQYRFDVDTIISQHTKRIRLELENRQKQQQNLLGAAVREKVINKLNEKDVQIQKMVKLNYVLQERVKALYNENQLWRELAQTNKATVDSLRANLQRISAQSAVHEEDAESCCSGSEPQKIKNSCYSDSRCRKCGDRESCVLLLPCRHLCLCNVCGSGTVNVLKCPVCNSSMNATLHVNMSP